MLSSEYIRAFLLVLQELVHFSFVSGLTPFQEVKSILHHEDDDPAKFYKVIAFIVLSSIVGLISIHDVNILPSHILIFW